jgi:hypothetical protein
MPETIGELNYRRSGCHRRCGIFACFDDGRWVQHYARSRRRGHLGRGYRIHRAAVAAPKRS